MVPAQYNNRILSERVSTGAMSDQFDRFVGGPGITGRNLWDGTNN